VEEGVLACHVDISGVMACRTPWVASDDLHDAVLVPGVPGELVLALGASLAGSAVVVVVVHACGALL
jgi:hypothetical protein